MSRLSIMTSQGGLFFLAYHSTGNKAHDICRVFWVFCVGASSSMSEAQATATSKLPGRVRRWESRISSFILGFLGVLIGQMASLTPRERVQEGAAWKATPYKRAGSQPPGSHYFSGPACPVATLPFRSTHRRPDLQHSIRNAKRTHTKTFPHTCTKDTNSRSSRENN